MGREREKTGGERVTDRDRDGESRCDRSRQTKTDKEGMKHTERDREIRE